MSSAQPAMLSMSQTLVGKPVHHAIPNMVAALPGISSVMPLPFLPNAGKSSANLSTICSVEHDSAQSFHVTTQPAKRANRGRGRTNPATITKPPTKRRRKNNLGTEDTSLDEVDDSTTRKAGTAKSAGSRQPSVHIRKNLQVREVAPYSLSLADLEILPNVYCLSGGITLFESLYPELIHYGHSERPALSNSDHESSVSATDASHREKGSARGAATTEVSSTAALPNTPMVGALAERTGSSALLRTPAASSGPVTPVLDNSATPSPSPLSSFFRTVCA